jgi:uroporphyrin-III C-methyltransferase / precorrin-2 dehydrogenase / sirohydrochlorin ferrochelatase
MEYLPAFLNVRDKPCLVVGGGDVAARKTSLLRRAGAHVLVIAPVLNPALRVLADKGEIAYTQGLFDEALLDGKVLAIAATDDEEVNQRVAREAQRRQILVNVVDRPSLCTFVFPSIIDRSPVVVAVSSAGASPVLARQLRAKLETVIPASYGRLAGLAKRFRDKVKEKFPTMDGRRRFWEKVLDSSIAEFVYTGREQQAEDALQKVLNSGNGEPARGEVYLVGGGPGDPDLLTFRALRLMQQADVVVYDRLVSKEVLDLVRRDAERIYVGKERDNHAVPQEGINQLLVRLAHEGRRVLRLKGGDPFIFGRGGEEIDTLAAEGIPFQVVPGITAAAGCASYSGIPLTHRDYSQAVVFVTGNLKDGTVNLNWKSLAQPNQTVVFYMGLHGVKDICKGLTSHGMSGATPVALIQQGTTVNQKVFVSTLDTLPALVQRERIQPPTLIIVGEVVRLHERLSWFHPSSPTTP